jgi:hypothetical protein
MERCRMATNKLIVVDNFKKIDRSAEYQAYSLILDIIDELEQIMCSETDRKLRSLIGYVISEVHQIRRNYEINLKVMEAEYGKS